MTDSSAQMLQVLCEMRDLLRLMAEPAIAIRDKKLRDELRIIGGKAKSKKAQSILLMDGTKSQSDIRRESGIDGGDLSNLVKKLRSVELLKDDPKPTLVITVPANFFESE